MCLGQQVYTCCRALRVLPELPWDSCFEWSNSKVRMAAIWWAVPLLAILWGDNSILTGTFSAATAWKLWHVVRGWGIYITGRWGSCVDNQCLCTNGVGHLSASSQVLCWLRSCLCWMPPLLLALGAAGTTCPQQGGMKCEICFEGVQFRFPFWTHWNVTASFSISAFLDPAQWRFMWNTRIFFIYLPVTGFHLDGSECVQDVCGKGLHMVNGTCFQNLCFCPHGTEATGRPAEDCSLVLLRFLTHRLLESHPASQSCCHVLKFLKAWILAWGLGRHLP